MKSFSHMHTVPVSRLSPDARETGEPARLERSLRVLYVLPWLAAFGTVCAALTLRAQAADALAGWGLAASVLLFGLPHGAGDWWVLRLAAGERWRGWARVFLVGGYVLAALLTLAFWWWQPGWALAGFLALTVWHFGSADALVLLPGRRPMRDAAWWLFALGRGLLVIGTPLAFRPAESAVLLEPFAALAGEPGRVGAVVLRGAPPLLWTGAALLTVGLQIAKGGRPVWPRDRALTCCFLETGVLLALFRLAPPLLAFACYFVAFHAWRHVLRIEERLHPEGPLPLGRALADFHRRTLPLTLLALPGLGLIFAVWPALSGGPAGWRTAYFVLLSALTAPHAMVIGWLDAGDTVPNKPL